MPNQAILHYVDDATRCIDDLVRIHEQRLIVHRAYFANQRGAETAVATKPPVERGLTVAHLLTLMVRKQYDGWMKTVGKMPRWLWPPPNCGRGGEPAAPPPGACVGRLPIDVQQDWTPEERPVWTESTGSPYGIGDDDDVEGFGDDLEDESDEARLRVSLGTVNSCGAHGPSA
ncbi:hypothetical protein TRAPUB_477 [Trametes pubescens]|uniref:Uncharacterized protein n=1 Tax=Trametes pubescens TaxID=154538 RepID=A0A1M2VM36_TRAPU|nr:hypothetical protein TRAPUB_477 [Trametes pubescens]